MKKIIMIYRDIMAYIGVIGLVGFIVSVLIQVISRTFLPTTPNWTEEASRYLFIYMVAFAGNAAIIDDEYVNVELLTDLFPKTVREILKTVIFFALAAFSAFVFFECVLSPEGLLAVTPESMVSTALRMPMKIVYMSMAFLFGFYIISFIMKIYLVFTDKPTEAEGGEQ